MILDIKKGLNKWMPLDAPILEQTYNLYQISTTRDAEQLANSIELQGRVSKVGKAGVLLVREGDF